MKSGPTLLRPPAWPDEADYPSKLISEDRTLPTPRDASGTSSCSSANEGLMLVHPIPVDSNGHRMQLPHKHGNDRIDGWLELGSHKIVNSKYNNQNENKDSDA